MIEVAKPAEEKPATTYEDILFNQLKGAKFVHPVEHEPLPQKVSPPMKDNGWAQFQAPAPTDRFDLIHDAFAELIEPIPN